MKSEFLFSEAALAGSTVVIVGGTGGLGLAATRACVGAGARVVAVGRDSEKAAALECELGAAVRVVLGNAESAATSQRAVAVAVQEFGGLHGLYHVAGGSGRKWGDGPLHEITNEGWEATLRLNLTSVFHSNQAAVRQFLAQGSGGTVVNCSSVLAFSPSPRFFTTHGYAAAKAAIIGLTTAAASHYAPQAIRFNVVAPALVATAMSARAQGDTEILDFIRTKQPLDGGRIGQPQDLDGAVVFLLSNASRFVTGQVIAVDGGWTVSEGKTAT